MLNVPTLPPKLEAVMVRLCKSVPLNKTQAVKLPYLVDVVAHRVLGRPISEGSHQAWDHGVVTSEAWHFLRACSREPQQFDVQPVPSSEEERISVSNDARDDALSEDEKRVVDYVIQEFSMLRAGELGPMTKLMNPEISTWGINRPADIGPDAFERMTDEYQDMAMDVARTSLDYLRRYSVPVGSIEEAIA